MQRKNLKISFPHEEVSRKFRSKIETVGKALKGQGLVVLDDVDAGGPGSEDNYVLKMVEFGIKTNDWEELIRSTTFKFYWVAKVRCKRNTSDLSVDMMARVLAEIFWLRVAMLETNRAAIAGKLKHLSPLQHSMYPDMLVVVGRAVTGFKQFFQKSYLPILMSGTRTAFLIMLWAHNLDHAGVDITFQTAL